LQTYWRLWITKQAAQKRLMDVEIICLTYMLLFNEDSSGCTTVLPDGLFASQILPNLAYLKSVWLKNSGGL